MKSLELKNTIPEIRHSLERLSDIFEFSRERSSKFGDGLMVIIQSKGKREKSE